MHDDDTASRLSPTTRRYRCWEIGGGEAIVTATFGFGILRFTDDEERLAGNETTSIGSMARNARGGRAQRPDNMEHAATHSMVPIRSAICVS